MQKTLRIKFDRLPLRSHKVSAEVSRIFGGFEDDIFGCVGRGATCGGTRPPCCLPLSCQQALDERRCL